MIRWIVRINEVVDRFLGKPFWFFLIFFLDFRLDMINKHGIINLYSYGRNVYACVVFNNSEVAFLEEDAAFVYNVFFRNCGA